jgi:hypothetical protein
MCREEGEEVSHVWGDHHSKQEALSWHMQQRGASSARPLLDDDLDILLKSESQLSSMLRSSSCHRIDRHQCQGERSPPGWLAARQPLGVSRILLCWPTAAECSGPPARAPQTHARMRRTTCVLLTATKTGRIWRTYISWMGIRRSYLVTFYVYHACNL